MGKIIFITFVILLLNLSLAGAITQQEINEAKSLIDSKADCKSLSDSQLEIIGEYEMELMHPGESHELMHQMMGIKEGSDAEKQFHINMAKRLYCNEDKAGIMGAGMMNGGMMSMMMGGYGGMGNMMGNNFGYGMMGNPFGYSYWGFWNIIWLLFWIGITVLIIWLIYKFIIKREEISQTPLEILRKRYAKGEITKKQFAEMKKEISGGK